MPWVEVFVVFFVSHEVGDYLLQTDWQATHKRGGLGSDHEARLALLSHVSVYTLAFLPARDQENIFWRTAASLYPSLAD